MRLHADASGLWLAGVPLAKRAMDGSVAVKESRIHTLLRAAYGKKLPPHAVRYIKRAAELLAEVSDDELEYGIRHEAVIYDANKVPPIIKLRTMLALSGVGNTTPAEMERLNNAEALLDKDNPSRRTRLLLKALMKDDDDSDDDDGSDDDSSDDDSDFDSKHPRWPAGSADGIGGEFRPNDESAAPASNTSASGGFNTSNSVDSQFRQAFQDVLNNPSSSSQSVGQLAQPFDDSNDRVEPAYPVEDAIALLGGGEIVQGIRGALAAVEAEAAEIASIIAKTNQIVGNDGIVASSKEIAENAAQRFVGEDTIPMVDRNTNEYIGQRAADGTKAVRYTSINDQDPYINLENKSTGGNLHVRWNNE